LSATETHPSLWWDKTRNKKNFYPFGSAMMMLIYSITLLMKAMTVFGYEWLKKRTDLDVFTCDWYELKPPNEFTPRHDDAVRKNSLNCRIAAM
jgi:hypothetical protein